MPGWAIASAARACVRGLGGLVLPGVCAGCGAAEPTAGGLCDACGLELLSLASLRYCPRCGSTLGPGIPERDDGCGACPAPLPRFARVVRLGPYAGPLRTAVRDLKYHRMEALRRRLGRLLAEAVAARLDAPADRVAPVPMHWRRRMLRGYDHARTLGREVARGLGLPLEDVLARARHTAPQVRLSRTQRLANVRGAFKPRRGADVAGLRIVLVDDVTTTGATASEAARTLLRAGASSVTLAVVAKSEPPTAYANR